MDQQNKYKKTWADPGNIKTHFDPGTLIDHEVHLNYEFLHVTLNQCSIHGQ